MFTDAAETGGAAASSVTLQIVADVTGLPLVACTEADTSAAGAAVLARSLVEGDADLAALSKQFAPARTTIQPGENAAAYANTR